MNIWVRDVLHNNPSGHKRKHVKSWGSAFWLYSSTDIQSLLSVVTSLLAFALFANKEYEKALEILRGKENTHDVGFHDLYLKGLESWCINLKSKCN